MRPTALLLLLLFAAAAHAGEHPEATVREFFQSYAEGKTLDAFWAAGAAGREPFERAARLTHRSRCLELHHLRVDVDTPAGDSVTARVTLLLTKRERGSGRGWGSAPIDYDVTLMRDGAWRVVDAVPRAEKSADALIAAPDSDARRALIAAAPEMLTADLNRTLIRRAIAASNVPDLGKAARLADIAQEIAEEISDAGGISLVASVRSMVARMKGDAPKARVFAEAAVDEARRVDDPDVLARALISLGRTHGGQPVSPMYGRIFREARALEERVEDLSLIVRALTSLEGEAWPREDYLSLRRYLDEEMRLAELAGDRTGLANAMNNLAIVYEQLHDSRPCIEYARRSGELFAEISPGDAYIKTLLAEARCLNQIGEVETGRARLDRALEIARRWKNREQEAWALVDLGYAELNQGHCEGAIVAAQQAAEVGTNPLTHLLLASALMKKERYAEAIEEAQQFRRDPESASPSSQAAVSAVIAKARRGMGDIDGALMELRTAVDAVERLRDQFPGDERQVATAFGEDLVGIYAEAVDLSVETGQLEDALVFAERAKGRALLDTLRSGVQRLTKSMTPDEEATEQRIESELAVLNRALAHSGAANEDTRAAREKLERARAEFASFHSTLYAHHPHLKAQRGNIDIASLKQMAETLPAGGAFVEYVIGEEGTIAFVIRRGAAGEPRLRARVLPIGPRDLAEKVSLFRAQLAARGLATRRVARELDAVLLAPIDDLLSGIRVIGIIPDGVLWQLPFEALIDARGRYRIETATIFYAPSISVLLEMQKNRSTFRPAADRVLAFGDPLVATSVRRDLSSVYRSADLSAIPDARIEVEALRTIYGREATTVYVGAAATESRVKSDIAGRNLLHFATHGILDDVSPMYSRLVLAESSGASGADSDGLLEAWELMKLDLDADLVVMSSCDSARGQLTAGEGMIGMSWAAFVAGARTTVASLWKVASKSTSTLMVDFHRDLRSRPSGAVVKAAALRRAKLRMLHDPEYQHPFYWAPFVVIGDPGR